MVRMLTMVSVVVHLVVGDDQVVAVIVGVESGIPRFAAKVGFPGFIAQNQVEQDSVNAQLRRRARVDGMDAG